MHSILKYSLFLLLAVVLSHCDEMCPAPTDIYPCTCSAIGLGLDVFCKGNLNDAAFEGLQKALNSLSGKKIEYLEFSSFNMEQAPPELFNGLVIRDATFRNTSFRKIPALKDSENTLQELRFLNAVSESLIQNFTLKISHLNKLKTLVFSQHMYYFDNTKGEYKTISVGNDWFENATSSLETVMLSRNKAKSFGDRAFVKLVNLKKIYLRGNRIEEVHRSMFSEPARRLLSIDLGDNKIKSLPEDIFRSMPVLDTVDVSLNSIKLLDSRTWRYVWEQLDSVEFGHKGQGLTCDSTINWTLHIMRPIFLNAFCDNTTSYEEYKGRSLAEIIDKA